MRLMSFVVAAMLTTLVLAMPQEQSPHERFIKAVAIAKENLATTAGRAYDHRLSDYFNHSNSSIMSKCFQEIADRDKRAFEMVFILSKNGTVQDILIWPETNIGTCFRNKLRDKSFPIPPKDGYHAYTEMHFNP